jgi:2'-5' RNA ligase
VSEPAPFILTLGVDAEAQARFESLRRRHFPAKRNQVPAHISLFHALPAEEAVAIRRLLAEAVGDTAAFPLEVTDVMKLGRGVAYRVTAPALDALNARLRAAWLDWLTPQDAQPYRPHVVIQNKAEPAAARALYEELAAGFRPWTVRAERLLLWRYLGGPWALEAEFPLPGN